MAVTEFEMQTVSPCIFVNDIMETIRFYESIGFQVITTVGDYPDPVFALLGCGGATFMFQTFRSIESTLPVISRTSGGSMLLYIKMKGIRNFYEKVKEKLTVLHPLNKTFYGATEFSFVDINHYLLTFAEDE